LPVNPYWRVRNHSGEIQVNEPSWFLYLVRDLS
jgi:hypothetical protein